jgi:hypothetical protein
MPFEYKEYVWVSFYMLWLNDNKGHLMHFLFIFIKSAFIRTSIDVWKVEMLVYNGCRNYGFFLN